MSNMNGIDVPGNALFGELRAKNLATKFIEMAQGYDNREILAALAICAGCTIRARYNVAERESAFVDTVNMMKHCKDQL